MHTRLLHDRDGQRTFAVILETNDEFPERLLDFVRDSGVKSAWLTALGAFSDATVAFWDPETHEYIPITIAEQVEVLSLVGNVAVMPDGNARVHSHAVLGTRDGHGRGGHLMKARIMPTLEIFLEETREPLTRRVDVATGLPLIRFDKE
jgi:hypothetical protein